MDSNKKASYTSKSGLQGERTWNAVTIIVLIIGIGAAGFFTAVDSRQQTIFNLGPVQTSTATASVDQQALSSSLVTVPALPSETPVTTPSLTPEPVIVSTPTPFPTDPVNPTFELRGEPVAVSSQTYRTDYGCNWMGIAGQAFDLQDAAVTGLVIRLGGALESETVDLTGMTGTVLQYGDAGYEISLLDHLVASQGTLWVQLYDQAGLALSQKIVFDTYDSCDQNLILLNFKQIR